MSRASPSLAWSCVIGASTGLLVTLGVWWLARRQLDAAFSHGAQGLTQALEAGQVDLGQRFTEGRQQVSRLVTQAVQREVPPAVDRQIRTTLASYGITPERSRLITSTIDRILA